MTRIREEEEVADFTTWWYYRVNLAQKNVVLWRRDSETDQLRVYKVLKTTWVDLCANINGDM